MPGNAVCHRCQYSVKANRYSLSHSVRVSRRHWRGNIMWLILNFSCLCLSLAKTHMHVVVGVWVSLLCDSGLQLLVKHMVHIGHSLTTQVDTTKRLISCLQFRATLDFASSIEPTLKLIILVKLMSYLQSSPWSDFCLLLHDLPYLDK